MKKSTRAQALHVMPIGDTIREHKTTSSCWCEPRFVDGVWVHNKRASA